MSENSKIRNTINYLKGLREMRALGARPVNMPSDPTWLVNQAINRRAGWLEDRHYRGTTQPVDGHFPRKALGDYRRLMGNLARRINRPRVIIRTSELGECRDLLQARLPERFTEAWE